MIALFAINNLETSFEKNELANLLANFEKVVLITHDKRYSGLSDKKLFVEIIDFEGYSTKKNFYNTIRYTLLFVNELFSNSNYLLNPGIFTKRVSSFFRANHLSNSLKVIYNKHNCSINNTICYTFWMNNWTTAFAILKSKGTDLVLYTRVHGTDLYEERVPITKRIAFRKFQLKHVTKVFSVSNKGSEYLKNKYPNFAQKISCLYLGTVYHGMNPLNHEKIITVVSCATIRNIKRIYLIPDILKEIKEQVLWIHIGGENKNDPTLPILKENLKHLPSNVKYEFKGALSNEEVFSFYKSTPVDVFISVSETEGLPISMMEAISFGIPIISTDVGGCDEIVNQETGALIPLNFDAVKVGELILEMKVRFNTLNSRNRVREFWKKKFKCESNFQQFLSEI